MQVDHRGRLKLTALDSLEDNMIAVTTREGGIKKGGRWDEECWKEMGDGREKINRGIGLGSFYLVRRKIMTLRNSCLRLGHLVPYSV
jgi:hypothetical protein